MILGILFQVTSTTNIQNKNKFGVKFSPRRVTGFFMARNLFSDFLMVKKNEKSTFEKENKEYLLGLLALLYDRIRGTIYE